jgi:hypothetical protein
MMTKLSTRLDRLMRIYHSIQKPYFRLRASKLFGVISRPSGLCCDGLSLLGHRYDVVCLAFVEAVITEFGLSLAENYSEKVPLHALF